MAAAENDGVSRQLGRECRIRALSRHLFSETACTGINLSACGQLSSRIVCRGSNNDRTPRARRGHGYGYPGETVVAQTTVETLPRCTPLDWRAIELAADA